MEDPIKKVKLILLKWKNPLLLLLLVLVLAIALRIIRLTYIPVFGDEAIYIRWSQIMRFDPALRFVSLSDGKQPLFMWLTIPFFKIFSDPLFAGRFVSAISGIGTLIGIFSVSYLLFKSFKVSLISSLIYAISPYALFFDKLALVDSTLSMFGVWTLFFSILTVKHLRLDTAILTGFMLGGALLTKSPATLFAILILTSILLIKLPKTKNEKIFVLVKLVFLWLITYGIGYSIYNILRLGTNFQMIALRNQDYVYPLTHIFSSPLDPLMPYFDRALEWFWLLGPFWIYILLVLGIVFSFKKNFKETLLLIFWGIGPILVESEYAKVFTARYIFATLPYIFIIAATPFLHNGKLKVSVVNVVFLIFVLHSLFIDKSLLTNVEAAPLPRSERSGYLEEWTSGYGIKDVANYLITNYGSQAKKVVVGTEGYFGTLPDGLEIYVNKYPTITVIGVGEPILKIPQSLIDSVNSGNKTYLVVNSTRLSLPVNSPNLKHISEYPKALRPDGTREKLYFFEVTK